MAALAGEDEARAIAREHDLWDAYRTRDRARLFELLHTDALDVSPAGALDRNAVVAVITRMEIVRYTLEDFVARAFDDVEVVTYRSTVEGTYAGKPFPAPVVRATTVWWRVADAWMVIHRHEMPVS